MHEQWRDEHMAAPADWPFLGFSELGVPGSSASLLKHGAEAPRDVGFLVMLLGTWLGLFRFRVDLWLLFFREAVDTCIY